MVFVHYDRDGVVDDYVLFYLASIRKLFCFMVFVSTAELSESEKAKVRPYADIVIQRENVGYDFFSYRVGLEEVKKTKIETYFEVVLCNDSVYGPVYPLDEMLDKMQTVKVDFWGVTDSHAVSHHIQSYFMAFRKTAFLSEVFSDFWGNMKIISDKKQVISAYEVGLSHLLETSGLKAVAYIDSSSYPVLMFFRLFKLKIRDICGLSLTQMWSKIRSKARNISEGTVINPPNPTHLFWRELVVRQRMPFVKVELLRENPDGVCVEGYREVLQSSTHYDVGLIDRHLQRVRR